MELRHPRAVERVELGRTTSDGAGVRLNRMLGHELQRRLDPWLMLDAFGSDRPDDYIAGFPDHPHRGFETVTYMIAGRMLHRDSAGHEGLLENGGVQWMTAGRGVIHSEIPQQQEGLMKGFQLWLNLPASDKLRDPWYRDFQAADLPQVTRPDGVTVTVIAGHSHGVEGAVQRTVTEPTVLDVRLPASTSFDQDLPAGHNAFVQVHEGTLRIGGSVVESGQMAILANTPGADGVRLEVVGDGPARALLVAGRPLNEPIVQYGPFVMNSEQQIRQAVIDYQTGRLA